MRTAIVPVAVLAAALAGCGGEGEAPARPASSPAAGAAPAMTGEATADSVNTERDPVCGMFVDPRTAPKSEYEGKTYYFCSAEDKAKFDKDPGAFTSQAP